MKCSSSTHVRCRLWEWSPNECITYYATGGNMCPYNFISSYIFYCPIIWNIGDVEKAIPSSLQKMRNCVFCKEEAVTSQLWFYLCLWGSPRKDSKNTRLNSFQGWRVTPKCFLLGIATRKLGCVLTYILSPNIWQEEKVEKRVSLSMSFTKYLFSL